MMTSAVDTSIHATSPLLGTGAEAAADAAEAAASAPEAMAMGDEAAAMAAEAGMALDAASEAAPCARAASPKASASRARTKLRRSFFMVWCVSGSEGVFAGLAGSDADDLLERRDEDLAVADLAGAGSRLDRLDDAIDDRVIDGGFDLHLGQKIDDVLGTPVQLGVPLLPAEALHLRHRDALNADGAQGLTHFVELERLDDRGHHLHGLSLRF